MMIWYDAKLIWKDIFKTSKLPNNWPRKTSFGGFFSQGKTQLSMLWIGFASWPRKLRGEIVPQHVLLHCGNVGRKARKGKAWFQIEVVFRWREVACKLSPHLSHHTTQWSTQPPTKYFPPKTIQLLVDLPQSRAHCHLKLTLKLLWKDFIQRGQENIAVRAIQTKLGIKTIQSKFEAFSISLMCV